MTTLFTKKTSFPADVITPVELYLKLRNSYKNVCLLESNDYHDRTNSSSIIGFDPLVEILLNDNELIVKQDNIIQRTTGNRNSLRKKLHEIIHSYTPFNDEMIDKNGFIGRMGFEYVHFIEKVEAISLDEHHLPDIHLFLFEKLIVIDHFHSKAELLINSFTTSFPSFDIQQILRYPLPNDLSFESVGNERSANTSEEFYSLVEKAQEHIRRGNVFQLVISNEYSQQFFGDDFLVYRSLRRLNPSPYLFYFDFDDYRLFGSSPEAQLKVIEGVAEIHPIAGTVKKTGNKSSDLKAIEHLKSDEKENAEHTMLVDLARNDLSKNGEQVKLISSKEIQSFSHVLHMVSKVVANVKPEKSFEIFEDTFPAGTLSGAPKPMAINLIAKYESTKRNYYGGAVGFLGFDGTMNTAIVIRSVLVKNNKLFYRAGAGVVLDSSPESELMEVENKINAIRKAISNTNDTINKYEKESSNYR